MQSTTYKTETNLFPKNEGTGGWQETEHSEEDRDASEQGRYRFYDNFGPADTHVHL